MSGGRFNHSEHVIRDIAEQIGEIVHHQGDTELDEWGNHRWPQYEPDVIERFQQAVDTLERAYAMVRRIDYLLSHDDGPDSFRRRWAEEVDANTEGCKQ